MEQVNLVDVSIIFMVIALGASFIPLMPGPVLVWAVGVISAAMLEFGRVTLLAVGVMTLIMIVGVASDFWLPAIGVKTGGTSCLASVGAFVGGIIGTFFIPIPILGTLIGCVVGALLVEFVRLRELRQAVKAGQSAMKMFILGYIAEVITSVAIFVTFVISLLMTG